MGLQKNSIKWYVQNYLTIIVTRLQYNQFVDQAKMINEIHVISLSPYTIRTIFMIFNQQLHISQPPPAGIA